MKILYLLAVACAVGSVSSQVCRDTEFLFMLDQSENARRASSTDANSTNFQYLKDAMRDFFNAPQIEGSASVRLGMYTYSSIEAQEILPEGSNRTEALKKVDEIGKGTHGGSWTHVGLQNLTGAPRHGKNLIVVLSSQGSTNNARRNRTMGEVKRLKALGWNLTVIALQGVNDLELNDLTNVNEGKPPIILNDTNPADPNSPKGYKPLSGELQRLLEQMCGPATGATTTTTAAPITTTAAPTTAAPPITTAAPPTTTAAPIVVVPGSPRPVTELCSECLFAGGYGYDFDPVYCDSFYQCFPDKDPIRLLCPAGTFWNGAQCNFVNSVACPLAVCDATTPANTRYHSGRCCNKYYQCIDASLVEIACPIGQVFDASSSQCVTPTDTTQICDATGRHVCDVSSTGPIGPAACNGYAPDPMGDPCYYQYAGYRLMVAYGTAWNQDICSLDFSTQDFCRSAFVSGGASFLGSEGPADPCTAVFRADFSGGSKAVYSDRLNQQLTIYTILNEASLRNDALVFSSGLSDPFMYYFFFNNRDLRSDSAFRISFNLQNPQLNTVYDLLSNNYCSLCPETISFTATATGANSRVVTATFLTTTGTAVSSSAVFDVTNVDDMLEVIVIFGQTSVTGQVNALSAPDTVRQTFTFTETAKDNGASIAINRCGIQLGRGPNTNFVGTIDDFMFYEFCTDITSILR